MEYCLTNGVFLCQEGNRTGNMQKRRVFGRERTCLAEGLYEDRRGKSGCGRSKTVPAKVEEALLAEAQRLHAENEYLKTCKPWFGKTSDASAKDAGSSETEEKTRSEDSTFNRSAAARNLLLSPEANGRV